MVKEGKVKGTINKVKKVLKAFDFFGESFTFTYKNEDKHSTALGGFICILFYLIALIYFIYKFIPFINKENFSLQYYTINLQTAKKLALKEDTIAFAFGITVDDNKNITKTKQLLSYLNITFEFVNKTKGYDKITKNNESSYCKNTDFPSDLYKSFTEAKISDFKCVDLEYLSNHSYIPKGIYTDDEFFYYIITVKLKDNLNSNYHKNISKFLIENDCKLQFYYTDITLDLSNHSDPNKTYINSMFLQLNPTLIQKKNVFYMNYHLYDDESIIHFGKDRNDSNTYVGFSRVEDYAQYIGENRTAFKNISDSRYYARLYIRADNKKVEIKRRYEDFMEFYADTSALLLSIFWILGVILAYYDRMKTNHEISKSLFYFKGAKEIKMEKNFGIKFEDLKIIKELIESKQKLEKERLDKEKREKENLKDGNKISTLVLDCQDSPSRNTNDRMQVRVNNFVRRNTNATLIYETEEKKEEKEKKGTKKKLIDYSSYNIFEMIGNLKIFFCKSKKFKKKMNLIEQANNLINDKLDVKFYIRNMILFEKINQIYLENKTILNFLSKPIIYNKDIKKSNEDKEDKKFEQAFNDKRTEASLDIGDEINEKKIDEKKEIDVIRYFEGGLYEKASKLNTTVLSEKITNLILHPDKTNTQKKLIYCLKNYLKGI